MDSNPESTLLCSKHRMDAVRSVPASRVTAVWRSITLTTTGRCVRCSATPATILSSDTLKATQSPPTTQPSTSLPSQPSMAVCMNRDCPKHFPWRPQDSRWYPCRGNSG